MQTAEQTADPTGAAARACLLLFVERMFPGYQVAPHHRLLAEHLEAVERGEIRRLIVELPPRHGKSLLASIHFPAWYLGRQPRRQVIAASYAAELAYTFSRQARNLFTAPGWPFPGVPLADDARGVEHWSLAAGGGYVAAGVGGSITGHGADLLLLDDPVRNREDADSDTVRAAQWEWYTSTARTRLQPGGAIVLCLTRWHEADLAGRLLRAGVGAGDPGPDGVVSGAPRSGPGGDGLAVGEPWTVLRLPARAELDDPLGRPEGSPLWPAWFSDAALTEIERAIGSRNWAALYQQRPSAQTGNLLQRDWWQTYTATALPRTFTQLVQSWDMAFKDTSTSDYVVGQVWGRFGADYYLLDQVRGRLDFPATLAAVRALSARWPLAATKLVEDTANGPAVIATLRHQIAGLVAVSPAGGKLSRVNAIAPLIEAGNVYLPAAAAAPWRDAFIDECAAFPRGAHDDQVDAMSQALIRLSAGQMATVGTANATIGGGYDSPRSGGPGLLGEHRRRWRQLKVVQHG